MRKFLGQGVGWGQGRKGESFRFKEMHCVKLNCPLKPPGLGIISLRHLFSCSDVAYTPQLQFLYILSFIQKKEGTECIGDVQAV